MKNTAFGSLFSLRARLFPVPRAVPHSPAASSCRINNYKQACLPVHAQQPQGNRGERKTA
ncbi:MAG: hypothetical protein A2010_15330 [Nitrospirae bacterium GWD2_57_9]|nr:MAG: hypothetical protein A2010_15330 [Nitrospirae bacterium GWD2_57_9]